MGCTGGGVRRGKVSSAVCTEPFVIGESQEPLGKCVQPIRVLGLRMNATISFHHPSLWGSFPTSPDNLVVRLARGQRRQGSQSYSTEITGVGEYVVDPQSALGPLVLSSTQPDGTQWALLPHMCEDVAVRRCCKYNHVAHWFIALSQTTRDHTDVELKSGIQF